MLHRLDIDCYVLLALFLDCASAQCTQVVKCEVGHRRVVPKGECCARCELGNRNF